MVNAGCRLAMATPSNGSKHEPAQLRGQARPGYALARFDAGPYGPEYLALEEHEQLSWLMSREEDGGWALGCRLRDDAHGWFPASYWAAGPPPPLRPEAVLAQPPWQPGGAFRDPTACEAPTAAALDLEACRWKPRDDSAPVPTSASRSAASATAVAENSASPEGRVYDRAFLLNVGIALVHCEEVPPDQLQIGLRDKPRDDAAHIIHRPEDAVSKLVDLAGGRAKIGNLAAAVLALGIMTGCHAKVCQDIVSAVRSRPDVFAVRVPELHHPPN